MSKQKTKRERAAGANLETVRRVDRTHQQTPGSQARARRAEAIIREEKRKRGEK